MRSAVVVMGLALLAAGPLAAQGRNVDVRLRGYEQTVRLDTLAVWTVIPASPAETYAAARAVLESLKMPVTTADSARGLLFMSPFNTSRRIMGKRMSWALYCGENLGVPNADGYRIHMSYAVYLEPTMDRQTRLGVALAAGANNVDGAFRPALGCGSTGALENELAMLVRARSQLK